MNSGSPEITNPRSPVSWSMTAVSMARALAEAGCRGSVISARSASNRLSAKATGTVVPTRIATRAASRATTRHRNDTPRPYPAVPRLRRVSAGRWLVCPTTRTPGESGGPDDVQHLLVDPVAADAHLVVLRTDPGGEVGVPQPLSPFV